MNRQKLKRKQNSYKTRAVKLKKEIEELVNEETDSYIIKRKCEMLGDQLKTIKDISEEISDILESDEEAATVMEEAFDFIDTSEDLIMRTFRKYDEIPTKKKRNESEFAVKGIKQPELPTFEGDVAKFEDWEAVFDAFVGTTDMDDKLKMLYLKNALTGPALKLVEGYRPSEAGYEAARRQLTDKYGGKARRIRNELNQVRLFPTIAEGDTCRLEEFANRVACLMTSLKESGSGSDISDVSAYYILVIEKLHHSYVKNYQRWLGTTGNEDNFETFVKWLEEEARCEKKAKELTKAGHGQQETIQQSGARMERRSRSYVTTQTSKPHDANRS